MEHSPGLLILREAWRFVCVGLALAALDVGVFRSLVHRLKWNRYVANTLSTTIALSASILANRFLVFRPEQFEIGPGIFKFLLITLTAAWGIQNGVLWWLSQGRWPAGLARFCADQILSRLGIRPDRLSTVVLHKLIACGSGMVWNFCWYRWWVFS